MSMSMVVSNSYLDSILKGQPQLPPSSTTWFNQLRAHALEHAGTLQVPTTRDEEWRFTDISPLTRLPLRPSLPISAPLVTEVERFQLDDATIRLVFVDGAFMPHLSSRLEGSEYEGLVVTDLSVAVATHAAVIEPHLGRLAGFENNLFAALNTAYLHHGDLPAECRKGTSMLSQSLFRPGSTKYVSECPWPARAW